MTFKEIDFRRIDLNLLVVFHALFDEHSVSRAAERLFIGASAVSMSLKRLRDLFGDELFVRTGTEMTPTPKADELAPRVADILHAAYGLVYATPGFEPQVLERTFRIGASEDCELSTLPRVFAELRRIAPQARITVRPIDYLSAPSMLDKGDIELALGFLPELSSWHVTEPLCKHGFACVFDKRAVKAAVPISMAAYLAHEHLVVSHRGDLAGVVDERLAQLGKQRRVVASTARFSVVPAWLSRSQMIATMPEPAAAQAASLHGLVSSPLPFSLRPVAMSMAWHHRLKEDRPSIFLRDLVRKVVKELFKSKRS